MWQCTALLRRNRLYSFQPRTPSLSLSVSALWFQMFLHIIFIGAELYPTSHSITDRMSDGAVEYTTEYAVMNCDEYHMSSFAAWFHGIVLICIAFFFVDKHQILTNFHLAENVTRVCISSVSHTSYATFNLVGFVPSGNRWRPVFFLCAVSTAESLWLVFLCVYLRSKSFSHGTPS